MNMESKETDLRECGLKLSIIDRTSARIEQELQKCLEKKPKLLESVKFETFFIAMQNLTNFQQEATRHLMDYITQITKFQTVFREHSEASQSDLNTALELFRVNTAQIFERSNRYYSQMKDLLADVAEAIMKFCRSDPKENCQKVPLEKVDEIVAKKLEPVMEKLQELSLKMDKIAEEKSEGKRWDASIQELNLKMNKLLEEKNSEEQAVEQKKIAEEMPEVQTNSAEISAEPKVAAEKTNSEKHAPEQVEVALPTVTTTTNAPLKSQGLIEFDFFGCARKSFFETAPLDIASTPVPVTMASTPIAPVNPPRPTASSTTIYSNYWPRSRSRSSSVSRYKRNLVCYNCDEQGHVAQDCRIDVICYDCRKSGHIARDCMENVVCWTCNENGHYARDCPGSDDEYGKCEWCDKRNCREH